jgi:hypothetical protein
VGTLVGSSVWRSAANDIIPIELLEVRRLLSGADAAASSTSIPRAYDAGDFYDYYDQKIPLLRATDELVVAIKHGVRAETVSRKLVSSGIVPAAFKAYSPLDTDILRFRAPSEIGWKKLRAVLGTVRDAEAVAWVAPSFFAPSGNRFYIANEITVQLNPGVDPATLFVHGVSSYRVAGPQNEWEVSLGKGGLVALRRANRLHRDPNVVWAAPDPYSRVNLLSVPNDPKFEDQWNLKNTGQFGGTSGADAKLTAAWDVTTGSNEITVAIVDDGVDLANPDLTGRIFTNVDEVLGNGIDDDGNALVDDSALGIVRPEVFGTVPVPEEVLG